MWKISIKHLWSRKRRLFATSTSVVLGVAFLVATLSLADTMRSGINDIFVEANAGTDVVVRSATSIGGNEATDRDVLPASMADDLVAVPGVARAVPIIEGIGQIVGSDGQPIGGDGPPATAMNWVDDPEINAFHV